MHYNESANPIADLQSVLRILGSDDGSIPEINFDFAAVSVIAEAYAIVQQRAIAFAHPAHTYWSRLRGLDIPIRFSDDRHIAAFLADDAEPFHVVFTGLRSSARAPIPDLGFFALARDLVSINYKMGPEWTEDAVIGLFEIIRDIAGLSKPVTMTQRENASDPDGQILLETYRAWLAQCPA